jgi:hypothetical protein
LTIEPYLWTMVGVIVESFSIRRLGTATLAAAAIVANAAASAQTADTRAEAIAIEKAEKAKTLHPYVPTKAERVVDRVEDLLLSGSLRWRPWFENAYAGGGLTGGVAYRRFVSPYNTIDLRGSITLAGYKRVEAEFLAPRLFDRRGTLSVIGGWREATEVGFYGLGSDTTSNDDRANYAFRQPYFTSRIEVWPTRRLFVVGGGLQYTKWDQREGGGAQPSVEERYTPQSLPGLGASPTYLHLQGGGALDWRTAPGYTRRGGAYGVTVHDFIDRDGDFGFRQIDYDVVQHLPILRDAWVLSLHGRVETTYAGDDEQVPFFMMPSLGGGSSLRGFGSWRFRDRHSLLLQAEWRVLANRFLDMALFYDAGKVAARRADLDFTGLKNDFGIGFRFHSLTATPFRIELAKSNEGLAVVFASKAAF